MSGSSFAFDHCLTLPMYHEMTEEEQDFVVATLIKVLSDTLPMEG